MSEPLYTAILVRAAHGIRVPVEGRPHTYLTDAEDVYVPATAYNLRRIADGDLVRVDIPKRPSTK